MIKKIIISGLIGLSAISFVACSDDTSTSNDGNSNGGGSGQSDVKSGIFSDSEVEGLSYSTPSQKGDTDAKGTFKYKDGESVEFKIGGITLGKAKAQEDMTPVTLIGTNYNDPKVVKILQFLQSIDSDHNPSNGITISKDFITKAKNNTNDFTKDLGTLDIAGLLTGLGITAQVTKKNAITHFKKTLEEIHDKHKKSATGFAIIEDVYQDGTTILDINAKGVINGYKYDQFDNCIKAAESGDIAYNINGKSLKHDANKKEYTFVDASSVGWMYGKNHR